jgi:hypothetical protein
VPTQDAQGRWISDDRLQYWDGSTWRPLAAQAPRRSSALPAILIGCGFAAVVILVLAIALGLLALNNPEFQRSFCEGYTNNNVNNPCPFHPSPS